MKASFLLLAVILFSCQSKEKQDEAVLISSTERSVLDSSILEVSTEDILEVQSFIDFNHDYYLTAIESAKDTISVQDFPGYKLDKFTRLKEGQSQFRYYLLDELSFYPSFRTHLIAEYYESEVAAWLANYSLDGNLLDWYEVYYDNAEGFYSKISFIDVGKKMIKIEENNIYESPENKAFRLIVTEKGKFVENP